MARLTQRSRSHTTRLVEKLREFTWNAGLYSGRAIFLCGLVHDDPRVWRAACDKADRELPRDYELIVPALHRQVPRHILDCVVELAHAGLAPDYFKFDPNISTDRLCDAMLAMIGWPDECADLMRMEPDAVKTLAALQTMPAAALYPLVVFENDRRQYGPSFFPDSVYWQPTF